MSDQSPKQNPKPAATQIAEGFEKNTGASWLSEAKRRLAEKMASIKGGRQK